MNCLQIQFDQTLQAAIANEYKTTKAAVSALWPVSAQSMRSQFRWIVTLLCPLWSTIPRATMEHSQKGEIKFCPHWVDVNFIHFSLFSETKPKKHSKRAELHSEAADGLERCAICESTKRSVRVPTNEFVSLPGWINALSTPNEVQRFEHNHSGGRK